VYAALVGWVIVVVCEPVLILYVAGLEDPPEPPFGATVIE
jgi:hypothetical protein